MCASNPGAEKYKRVCEDFPNVSILTYSATSIVIQLTFGHAAGGNKSLWESVVALLLVGDLSSSSTIFPKTEIAFSVDCDKICLLIVEVFLCAVAADLLRSKKQRIWTPCNTVLLPPFLMEATILHGKLDAGELLKIFARSIMEWANEEENTSEADEANNDDIVVTIEDEDAKAKPGKAMQAATKTLTTITEDCDNILAFLQAVAVKYPRVIAALLSLCADKRARLVPTLGRRQPPHANQAGPTIPPGSHRRPVRRGDPVAHRVSAPPRCRRPARGGKRDKWVGPPPTNSPARHPGGECYHQNLHSDLAAPHYPPLPQQEE